MDKHIIPIGSVDVKFRLCDAVGAVAVYQKIRSGSGVSSYVIALSPRKTDIGGRPGSVLQEFDDEQTARAALARWAQNPVPPKSVPKRRALGAYRRNSNCNRRATELGTGQLDLPLS
jgi:hypothetical protein